MSVHQGACLSKEEEDRCSSRPQGGSVGPRISLYENILAISRTPFGIRKHLFPQVALGVKSRASCILGVCSAVELCLCTEQE